METGGGPEDLSFFGEWRQITWLPWVYLIFSWLDLEAAVRFGWIYR